MEEKFILDACCGGRMFWFDKKHPNVLYIDVRKIPKGIIKHKPNWSVEPDVVMDFRKLNFSDESFNLVVWDPPHMKEGKAGTGIFGLQYGSLNKETWAADLKMGFSECWRVLAARGILIFKWSENQIKLKEILELFPERPLFGHTTGAAGKTHWMCFMKIPEKNNGK